jgi:tetratricopeptide (TPR) repeat protein
MTKIKASDTEWLQWIEIQKAATEKGLVGEDLPSAIEMLDRYLAGDLPHDLRREAVAFRATLYQEQGNLAAAKSNFLSALELAVELDHVRFELEDSLAEISKKLGDTEEADKWYVASLRTAAADPRVAGGGFLLRLLKFRGERGLNNEEQKLVRKVVHQSWHLLRVEGEPDLSDLVGTARKLRKAQLGPFSAERPLTPKAYTGP